MLKDPKYIDLLDKPFVMGGRGPDFFDCWGLCLEVGSRVNIIFPADFTPPDTKDQNDSINRNADINFVKLEKPEPFCIVTFKITPPFVDHCGIVMSNCSQFLHIMRNHSVALQRLDNRILAPRIDGFYRLRK